MRNGQNNKRMRNRNNNNNNNNRRGQNPMTRVYESNGPEIKIRGTASHVAEKYVQLARPRRARVGRSRRRRKLLPARRALFPPDRGGPGAVSADPAAASAAAAPRQ